MTALTAQMLLPEGQMALVSDDVLAIDRRIREGDELWRGDPSMSLGYNFARQMFEVWGVDAHGEPYLAASNETCDHQLLEKLTAGDWQRGKEAALSVVLHERALREERERADRDARGETIERLRHAIKKDFGHLEGGTRGTWGWTRESER